MDSSTRVTTDTLHRDAFTDGLLAELYVLSHRLMEESEPHFRAHALANDVVHVFRRADTREAIGFQFWRTLPMTRPGWRAIVGGKLRILPAFRRRGLHLESGLRFYAQARARHPLDRFYRLSIASIFGYVSIVSALARVDHFEPASRTDEGIALHAAFTRVAEENDFAIDPTGLFDVGITMSVETLKQFDPLYFQKPAARAYASINPEYRHNGRYVGFWFRFTAANLLALAWSVARARARRP